MLAVHALLVIGYLSADVVRALTTLPQRPVRSTLTETRADVYVGHGLRPRHPLTHDTCLYANATTLSDITFPGLSSQCELTDLADTDTCLCLSGLSATLEGLSSTASLVDELGLPEVEGVFGAYIASSAFAKACTYPPNSQPQCTRDNVCGFSCDPPFVAVGGSCVCQDANGCDQTTPPVTCQATGQTRRLSKRSTISTLAMAQSACEADETVCGAFDGATASFQCVDVQTSLDSCGGCMMPNPFGLRVNDRTTGVDCTAIPSVDAVSCLSGKCVVQSCLTGWTVDSEGTGCIREQTRTLHAPGHLDDNTRRGFALQSHPNQTSSHDMKPHSDWRIPDIRSEIGRADRTTRHETSPMQIKEDWTRIPDIRRGA